MFLFWCLATMKAVELCFRLPDVRKIGWCTWRPSRQVEGKVCLSKHSNAEYMLMQEVFLLAGPSNRKCFMYRGPRALLFGTISNFGNYGPGGSLPMHETNTQFRVQIRGRWDISFSKLELFINKLYAIKKKIPRNIVMILKFKGFTKRFWQSWTK